MSIKDRVKAAAARKDKTTGEKPKGSRALGCFILAFAGTFVSVVGLFVAGIGTSIIYQMSGSETVRGEVTDKERIAVPNGDKGDSKYLVFTNSEVFENTDSLVRGKLRSSDIQGKLRIGCTYDFNVYGFRSGFLSTYRNITEVKHVPTSTCPKVAA